MVVGALGSSSKKLKKCIELGVVISTALLQKTALLGTDRMEVFRLRIKKKKVANEHMGRGREIAPKTEQVRKNVKV